MICIKKIFKFYVKLSLNPNHIFLSLTALNLFDTKKKFKQAVNHFATLYVYFLLVTFPLGIFGV